MGPILFLIYVNDIDANISSNLTKFADDTKISGIADNLENCEKLQSDVTTISEWGKTWDMQFNIDKCHTLHTGYRNIKFSYNMSGSRLSESHEQKDLGIIITHNLKFGKQCIEASNKANRVLGFISRTFEYKSKDIILPLYKSLVRPLLEYAVQFWSPYYLKDILTLERIQRRATKMIPSLRNLPYKVRLEKLHLQTLELRRIRGQLIEVFKILNGYDELENLFARDHNVRTRNNGCKLKGKRCCTDVANNFFSNSIVKVWNILPANVVAGNSINNFKDALD